MPVAELPSMAALPVFTAQHIMPTTNYRPSKQPIHMVRKRKVWRLIVRSHKSAVTKPPMHLEAAAELGCELLSRL